MPIIERFVPTTADMEHLGMELARRLGDSRLIYIYGPLGAGKTTLVRGILRALGHAGAVKSPTFTLVEPYRFGERSFYHFDLYRLNDPEELEFLGVRDYLHGNGVSAVEWAERAEGFLPTPDLDIMISTEGTGRRVCLRTRTDQGDATLDGMP